ncbi:hypothetical protein ELI13_37825 [Rhizobium ruizarguesonis]|uniref:Uncharacterized protein n=2 Tax=Rhizobium ruizarguesonis TaxID=2081791 RepID=A0ABY1WWU7_9HYPH|nr:hypothetical protein ELI48_38410 [Rhizobium ruizarguesonis]TAU56998.1 hypothetical protein ELI45_38360 [Rhizobium ruizarguesonis]TAU57431.1 hypothetical protein ELI46_39755 [Rhizobium ruizarguesonis]TAV01710.1 hypothetical protein ELI34_38510 [Rhizobium ruizarguesonis]TAV18969.1 hypothetical protein ELI36_38035 [Rhizobium ruizarguesonis]
MNSSPLWSADLDALRFTAGNGGNCLVHRRAFRAVLRKSPLMEDCIAFYEVNQATFQAAATKKIEEHCIGDGQNFHLNSRQIRRGLAMTGLAEILHDQTLDGQLGA